MDLSTKQVHRQRRPAVHTKRMDNKVLPYSTHNYTQCLVTNPNGEEYRTECICMLNHVAVQQKVTQHCESIILQLEKA